MRLKALTIRILVAVLAFTAGLTVNRLSTSPQRTIRVLAINPEDDKILIFEGVVLKIGPPVPGSGTFAFYRLAKYRVDRVTYGHYKAREIVVDHLSVTTHELDGLDEGSRVCVIVERTNPMSIGHYAKGIREREELVDTFYVGRVVHSGSCYQK